MDIEKLKQRKKELGLSFDLLAEKSGIPKTTLTNIFCGRTSSPRIDTMQAIEKALGLSDDLPNNVRPLDDSFRRMPVIGSIRAGYDGQAVEEFTGEYQDVPADVMRGYSVNELFVLDVRGDSMYPFYLDGDRVLIHKEESVDSGTVAAVLYDGEEATLKKVTYEPNCEWVLLTPLNPVYKPMRIEGADLQNCRVLGKVIYLFRKI